MKERVLGSRVDLVTKQESIDQISAWIEKSKSIKLVATAYSEFFVAAASDVDFRMALEGSDLVTPDGIGPLAAIYYRKLIKDGDSTITRLVKGLATGGAILSQKVGEPVSGYWLFQTLVKMASEKKWKVFLLGGFGGAASELAEKLSKQYPSLVIESSAGVEFSKVEEIEAEADRKVIKQINEFKPDLLFVAYGPVKQEKWLMKHRGDLKAKVAMGVGGTFDEALGRVKEAPVAFSRFGLKWFWRLLQQPSRLPRIFKATFVFAYMVFAENSRRR